MMQHVMMQLTSAMATHDSSVLAPSLARNTHANKNMEPVCVGYVGLPAQTPSTLP
jgi:hypothetical protein